MTCLPSVHVFFFKQKTAYEMRMSDWSSDVCSSDLIRVAVERADIVGRVDDRDRAGVRFDARAAHRDLVPFEAAVLHVEDAAAGWPGLPVADAAVARIGAFGLDADLALRLSRRGDGAGGGNAGRERGDARSNAQARQRVG